jgi:hypothetical protein
VEGLSNMPASLTLVRIALPTPDVVVVRDNGTLIVFADASLPADIVEDAITNVDQILKGPAYPLAAS